MHDLCVAEVGAAHRAAANLPDFELLKNQKNQENYERARSRGAQAIAQEKIAADKVAKEIKRAKIYRENVRRDEDERLKDFVQRPQMTKSQAAVDRIMDKLTNKRSEKKRRPEYQPSLAKTLRVPKESNSETKTSKSKKHTRLSRKPKDVVYYDFSIPQGSLKYPPPPGLVQKVAKNSDGTAFEIAKRITHEQYKKEKKQKADDLEKAKEADRRGKTALKVAKLQRQLDELKNEFMKSGFHVDPKLNDSFLGLSDSESEGEDKETDTFETRGHDEHVPMVSPKEMTKYDKKSRVPGSPKPKHDELPEANKKSPKVQESPKFDVNGQPKSPKKVTPPVKSIPKSPQKDSHGHAVIKPSPTTPGAKTLAGLEQYKPEPGQLLDISKDGSTYSKPISGRLSPLEKSIVLPPDRRDEPDTSTLEKPKLISTRKSIRNQQNKLESATTIPADARAGKFETADKNQITSVQSSKDSSQFKDTTQSNGRTQIKDSGQTNQTKDSSKTKEARKSTDSKYKSVEGTSSAIGDDIESSESLHTLPTIGSHTNEINKQITDHRSPPDLSDEFPFTSTPATANSKMTSMNITSCSQGPVSPTTARKRKKALMYYVKKLLEMRPESMNNLAATSSGSISSCIEIPSSAVSSLISSSPLSGSTSNSSSVGETTKSSKSKYTNSKYFSTTNGTTDHYTTLSSVTEEDEDEPTSELQSYEQDSEQTSSGETLAKITVALSPRSNSGST
ncbi:unnamed protein product [Allacma fusca]|uniref:Uncharacterized protein n=1 Tax=Allacma fusca TaxID=39272 RepID=A0A8J2K1X5_9HEXA|nr:unnamed protein product [Allacma fusca]